MTKTTFLFVLMQTIVSSALLVSIAQADHVPYSSAKTVTIPFDRAWDVHAADIDGDGDLDVVGAAAGTDSTIVWWENIAGDGSAWSEHALAGGFPNARAVYAVDVDGDGDMDVLTAQLFGSGGDPRDDITWWENTAGDGSAWTGHTVTADFDLATDVVGVDMDGDGDIDVLGTERNDDRISWWENTSGDGSAWTEHTVVGVGDNEWRLSVVAADVDGDGDLDVLATAQNAGNIKWWENTAGNGSAWTEHTVDGAFVFVKSVFAADLDGDGDLDVLGAAAGNTNDVIWWENTTGDGSTWSKHTVDGAFDGALSVFAADFDDDGDMDILGAAEFGDQVVWWENAATDGSVWSKHAMPEPVDGARSVLGADVDGDGDTDILAVAGLGGGAVYWWEQGGIILPPLVGTEHPVATDFSGANSVSAADVDGDGDMDVVGAAAGANGQVAWWENTSPDGSAWTQHTLDADFDGSSAVSAKDMDGDGDIDIVAAGSVKGIVWFENDAGNGSAWSSHTVNGAYVARSMAVEDIDGDGDMDIMAVKHSQLIGSDQDSTVVWWENSAGDGSAWIAGVINTRFSMAMSVFAADVDGDGDMEALAASYWNGICWWSYVGQRDFWPTHFVGGGGTDPTCSPLPGVVLVGISSVSAADVDGDGDMDLLGTAEVPPYGGWVKWWENTSGNGSSWQVRTISSSMDNAAAVTAVDLDGDGDLDVIASAVGGTDKIAWWENVAGNGSAWAERTGVEGFRTRSIFAADVDGDGGMDILGAGNGAAISWWENSDNCPLIPHSDQTDTDGDGHGDVCDAFPADPNEWLDTDGDGVGDNADEFPSDPDETADTDGDGIGDNADAFPIDPNETLDTDGDGIGNNADLDDDGDGVPDVSDDYPLGRFADAPSGYWAFSFIEALARAGITAGCGGGNYCPTAPVTRAQMAVFLERGMNGSGYSPPAATGNVFLDVGAQDFAASFIEQLANDGITAGCGNNNYCPDAEVTRDQMAIFLLRAKYGSSYSPPTATGVFGDVDLGHWAVHWIEQLAAEGITAGCGGGDYCPDALVTRDQMAVFLVRTFGL